ncbi:hypothetical protein Tco_1070015 [Tanacetum coccineum]|uniref:Uncharacterized protein n=1 Tax=Tanacetum coccineum TaxID=301880 RepID=A0ABQ5HMC7_9ASTR
MLDGVKKVMPPTTTEEKAHKRLEVKARSTLMMGIPNEHLLKHYTANGVSAANTQVNTANIDNLSDDVICAFLASQPNNPQLAHKDLQQIHPDDLEEMDLRWQMAIPKWSATTATRRDILLKSIELQEIKTTRTRKAQEGLCLWKHPLLQLDVK